MGYANRGNDLVAQPIEALDAIGYLQHFVAGLEVERQRMGADEDLGQQGLGDTVCPLEAGDKLSDLFEVDPELGMKVLNNWLRKDTFKERFRGFDV